MERKKIGVFSVMKDEYNVIEFMEHYYELGFEYIVIYDDNSLVPIQDVIGNRFKEKYLILDKKSFPEIEYYLSNSTSKSIWDISIEFHESLVKNECKHNIYKETDYKNHSIFTFFWNKYFQTKLSSLMEYCFFIDGDEYLYIKYNKKIQDIFDLYMPFDQLKINWLFFGSNDKGLKYYTEVKKRIIKSSKHFNKHVKSLFKLDSVISMPTTHAAQVNGVNKNILNEISILPNHPFEDKIVEIEYWEVDIYLAHYHIKSLQDFFLRRFCRMTHNTYALFGTTDKDQIQKWVNYANNNYDKIIDYMDKKNNNEKIDNINLEYIDQINCILNYINTEVMPYTEKNLNLCSCLQDDVDNEHKK